MAAVFGHSMVAKDHQSGIVIHLFNDLLNCALDVVHFALQCWVPSVVAMTSMVHPNQMSHHEVEIRPFIELW